MQRNEDQYIHIVWNYVRALDYYKPSTYRYTSNFPELQLCDLCRKICMWVKEQRTAVGYGAQGFQWVGS